MAVQEKAGQAGGNPRFKGAGRLWKSGWKSASFVQELCCVGNFQLWYQNPNPLPLVPADGFFIGAVVGVSDSGVSGMIASNGNGLNRGWSLQFVPVIGSDSVEFIFDMGDGAAYTSVGVTVPLYTPGEEQLLGTDTRYFAVLAGYAPQNTLVNGRMAITVADPSQPTGGPSDGVAPPVYSNTTPFFYIGGGPRGILTPPNCVAGVVGGRAQFDDTTLEGTIALTGNQWAENILAAGRVVPVPDLFGTPGFANEHGYRIDLQSPGAPAPDPWLDFVDGEDMDLLGGGLVTGCAPLLLGDAPL